MKTDLLIVLSDVEGTQQCLFFCSHIVCLPNVFTVDFFPEPRELKIL